MSADSFTNLPHKLTEPHLAVGKSAPGQTQPTDAEQMIVETRNQIRRLVDEIAQLADSPCSRADFFAGFLNRATQALASVGGAIWLKTEGGVALEYQINFSQTELAGGDAQSRHQLLLAKLLQAAEPSLIPPQSGSGEQQAGNPTPFLLVVCPLSVDQQVVGLIEIFQRPDSGPTTQRGYLRFLVQIAKIASRFLNQDQLRSFRQQQQRWSRTEQFTAQVHSSLEVRKTLYAIANEGRRVLQCDRLSVAMRQGQQCRVEVVSGLDAIERRAEQAKQLGRLAAAVLKTNKEFWYRGDDSQLPPQIETPLHQYLDIAHSKALAIIPLREPDPEPAAESAVNRRAALGAIIVEQLGDSRLAEDLPDQIRAIGHHASLALANAVQHDHILLAPLWKTLGQATRLLQRSRWPKTMAALTGLTAVIAALCLVPYPFTLGASGQLIPQMRHEIFARVDGVLQEVLVPDDPDAIVQADQLLARMTNSDLMVEVRNLEGQLNQLQQRIKKLSRALVAGLPQVEQLILEGDLAEAQQSYESVQRQLALKQQQLQMLEIRSPVRGHVVNWQLRQNLLRRPVQRGQNLMTVVAPDAPWSLELEMPERRVAHLVAAQRQAADGLAVTFSLASRPGAEFTGRVVDIQQQLDVRSDTGNAALVLVHFDEGQIDPSLLKTGTRVTAKVNAGTRSLGYVWFHELVESVQSRVLFWF